jgi:hypothetical protein
MLFFRFCLVLLEMSVGVDPIYSRLVWLLLVSELSLVGTPIEHTLESALYFPFATLY